MSTIQDKVRAVMSKTVANGCTEEEALSAYEMAVRLINKHGLAGEYEFAQFIGAGFQSKPKGKAKKAKAERKPKAPKAPKQPKQPKDDGRLREILVATKGENGRNKWIATELVSQPELKARLKALRDQGKQVKSRVAK
jgi:hypothetical protein